MKINSIFNNYINFKGAEKDISYKIFQNLLENPKSCEISHESKYDENIDSEKNKPMSVPDILGRYLVKTAFSEKPKRPFEISDKTLVLDEYQNKALDLFRTGNSVMVTAPTGTGKTLIAEHVIDDILKSGKKVIYTTPLKALCNDKYNQFSELWGDYDKNGKFIGSSKVGLATGDVKINVNAPLVIMTTEIYRNMLISQGEKSVEKDLKNVDAVIFDEFHYMGDSQRGSVWEEAVMFSPPRIKLMMLSATIANAEPICEWIKNINNEHKSAIVNVPEEERHVPLKHYSYSVLNGYPRLLDLLEEKINLADLRNRKLNKRELETLSQIGSHYSSKNGLDILEKLLNPKENTPNDLMKEFLKSGITQSKAQQYVLRLVDNASRKLNPVLTKAEEMKQVPLKDLISDLKRNKMMPALYFVYSRKNCKTLMKEASEKIGQILTDDERCEVEKRIKEVESKGIFLGTDFEKDIKPCLLNGFAMHNAGMLPQCKSFIEKLGRSKLVKVCFATDTLGAGINFPFKTVIFSDFEKFNDTSFEEISVNAFKQGAGRAGRRGIDDIGYVVSVAKDKNDAIIPYKKIIQNSDDVKSAFKLSYGLVLSPRFLNNSSAILNRTFDAFQKQNSDDNQKKSMIMKDILLKFKCIEHKNGKFKLTERGKIASKTKGINEILLAKMLTSKSMMENILPQDFAELISVFSPEKEDKVVPYNDISSKTYSQRLAELLPMAMEIKEEEQKRGVDNEFSINTIASPYVKLWANTANSQDSTVLWSSIVKTMTEKGIIKTEGDFLKKINFTINILKQIQKIAPTVYIREVAKEAVKKLQKSPVNDILLYELNYKEENE